MKTIKIWFTSFWPGFDPENNFFVDMLIQSGFEFVIDNINPDVLFYSVFNNEFLKYKNCKKIWFSGENWGLPNFEQCDFALSGYHIDDPRHYRLPLYVLYYRNYINAGTYKSYEDIANKKIDIEQIMKSKTKFCIFIYSRCVDPRNSFFKSLNEYKHIDSGGGCLNNLGYRIPNKTQFIKDYKFTVAFENSSLWNDTVPGYTTEKIFEPMIVNSVPIYWGNPLIHLDFNQKSFINYFEYDSFDEMINKIIKIDTDDNLYYEYLNQQYVISYENSFFNINKLCDFLKEIL